MMKWKVVKHPGSASLERSSDVPPPANNPSPQKNDTNNNSNSDQIKKDTSQPSQGNLRQDSALCRKPSIVATDCINLKGILGLARQRSETNLSDIGLVYREPRRSRSEVRGTSCDRLVVGYHTTPVKPFENGKTRSSSPTVKQNGWLRGRKRERESRCPFKNVAGKTVVTSSHKVTNSRHSSRESRTILDGSDSSSTKDHKENGSLVYNLKNDIDTTKWKGEPKEAFARVPNKVIRKKGMAPKPQITNGLFNQVKANDQNLPNGIKANGSVGYFEEQFENAPVTKPPRKVQTFNGRGRDKNVDNSFLTEKPSRDNQGKKPVTTSLKNKKNACQANSLITIAEVHKNTQNSNQDETTENLYDDVKVPESPKPENKPKVMDKDDKSVDNKQELSTSHKEGFHIDTPDYSTLNSDAELDKEGSKENSTGTTKVKQVDAPKMSSIKENSTSDCQHSPKENKSHEHEPVKRVRFENVDLIDDDPLYESEDCLNDDAEKSESETEIEFEAIVSEMDECEPLEPMKEVTDTSKVSEPEVAAIGNSTSSDVPSPSSPKSPPRQAMTVNVVVKNPSSGDVTTKHAKDAREDDTSSQFVVKKSFVLTIAKQEKGFKSLCANKKSEQNLDNTNGDHQISVTFLCSGPSSETWINGTPLSSLKLRSLSAPPKHQGDVLNSMTPMRSRSRERRSKEKPNCKKNHKTRKKDTLFHMPQAVIDELSQVLEKRKPSLEEIRA